MSVSNKSKRLLMIGPMRAFCRMAGKKFSKKDVDGMKATAVHTATVDIRN